MATAEKLGTLTEITDLREVWKTEAKDFTPWLAQEHNLSLLADTLQMDLELEATEKDVGAFRADILCKETGTGNWVLIENQIERTDHTHLGQILTYAAGINAVTIVWIAKEFSDEHRATLDWLNEVTGETVAFFGLEIELWRIGDSPIAPKFGIVSKPNEWTKGKGGTETMSGELTEGQKLQLDYWTALREYSAKHDQCPYLTKALPQNWMSISLGRSGFQVLLIIRMMPPKGIGMLLEIAGKDREAHFRLLQEQKEDIEGDIGTALKWEHRPDRKTDRLYLWNPDFDPKKRSTWTEQHKWLLDTLERFHTTFSSRAKELDASDWNSDELEVGE